MRGLGNPDSYVAQEFPSTHRTWIYEQLDAAERDEVVGGEREELGRVAQSPARATALACDDAVSRSINGICGAHESSLARRTRRTRARKALDRIAPME